MAFFPTKRQIPPGRGPVNTSSIPAAGDEQADLGVARAGFSELQSLEQQQRLPRFLCARAGGVWRGVAWRGVFLAPKPPWA